MRAKTFLSCVENLSGEVTNNAPIEYGIVEFITFEFPFSAVYFKVLKTGALQLVNSFCSKFDQIELFTLFSTDQLYEYYIRSDFDYRKKGHFIIGKKFWVKDNIERKFIDKPWHQEIDHSDFSIFDEDLHKQKVHFGWKENEAAASFSKDLKRHIRLVNQTYNVECGTIVYEAASYKDDKDIVISIGKNGSIILKCDYRTKQKEYNIDVGSRINLNCFLEICVRSGIFERRGRCIFNLKYENWDMPKMESVVGFPLIK